MVGTILAWVKANLLIVISSALILILLPTGWFFSNNWNNSIQEKATKAYNEEKRRLNSASTIEYSLPSVLKGEDGLSERRAPNSIVTKFYEERKAEREIQVAEVVERGTAFNSDSHIVPVEGLLPKASSATELRKQGARLSELVAGTEEAPSLYTRILRKLNAGDAPDPENLTSSLKQYKSQQEDAYAATSSDGRVSAEQTKLLDQDLVTRRLGEYAGRAESIAFYCPLWAIQTDKAEDGYSYVHADAQAQGVDYDSITELMVYTWVWDYWVISDVLKAVAAGNIDASGVSLAVPDAPVKHIEMIGVSEFVVSSADEDAAITDDFGGGGRDPRGGGYAQDTGNDEPTATQSYTGRATNNAYDIRYVDMTIIASSQDLPKFFDALGKTNYMTVIDMDLSEVDVYDALKRGYYYGDDHLVRATIKIETVWLRSWTAEHMPETVRSALGIFVESDNPDEYDG